MRYDAVGCVPLLRVVRDGIMRDQAVGTTSVGEGWGTSGSLARLYRANRNLNFLLFRSKSCSHRLLHEVSQKLVQC